MNMPFREKSIWISLISTMLIFGDYFLNVIALGELPGAVAKTTALELAVHAFVLIIIVEMIFQTILALSNHQAAKLGADERDKSFDYRGNNFGYTVLVICVLLTLGRMVSLEISPEFIEQFKVLNIPFLTAHILLFSFILSEVVRFSAPLYYYRRCD
jgi:hypothetical protein